MKTKPTNPMQVFYPKITLVTGIACLALSVNAQPSPPIFWTGPTTNYMEPAPTAADVLIPGVVSIARDSRQWLYNTNTESGPTATSPTFTVWAFGSLANATNLTYVPFANLRNGDLGARLVTTPPSPMVCHLTNATMNIYVAVTFTAWTVSDFSGTGFFAYTRSTPGAVTPPTPTVSITSPTNNAVFAAPADVAISANASVSTGTVTNVSFFGNGSLLGSSQTSPFGVTTSSLGAGPYALTAVATAAGVSATSAVVNVTVVAPPTVSITSPANNAVFAAPANVIISANATESGGTVTNVSFFSNGSLVGSSQIAPFSATAGSLGAGPYALSAVATASGLSTTSSVVNVTIVTPVVTSLSGSTMANNQFIFSYNVNPGLSYVVEDSSNLQSGFTPMSTNVPASSPAFFTNPVSGSQNFFRVGLMPNP